MLRSASATVLAFGVGLGLLGVVPATAGDLNDTPDGPLRRAPYDPDAVRKTVAFWERRVERYPDRFLEHRELAGAYLARQRETGDVDDAVRAERAARRSLKLLARGNVPALNRLARALLAQHRFPEALEAAGRAAKVDPKALLLVADVELELGHDGEARRALAKADVDPQDLHAIVLRARFADADHDPDRALRLLREASRRAEELTDLPAEAAAWFHVIVGHALIDRGRPDEGACECRNALDIFPRDYRAMTGLAEAAASRRDWDEVITWGRRAIEASPQNPEALALLFEASSAIGDGEEADRLARRFKELAHSSPRIYDRHWALFCADHGRDLDEAYALAKKDLELRQDAGAYDTLAWVSYKKGLQAEAESAMRLALDRNPRDASSFLHAEAIARAGGDLKQADAFLARARELNPYLVKLARSSGPATAD
jgi:tetratricopeptide (TPR) repeat protein